MNFEENPFAVTSQFTGGKAHHNKYNNEGGNNHGRPNFPKKHQVGDESQPFQKNQQRRNNKQDSDDDFEVVDNQKRVPKPGGFTAPHKKGPNPHHHHGVPQSSTNETN